MSNTQSVSSSGPKLLSDVEFNDRGYSIPRGSKSKGPHIYTRVSKSDRSPLVFQMCKPDKCLFDNNTSKQDRQAALSKLPSVRTGFHLDPEPKFDVSDGKYTVHFSLPDNMVDDVDGYDRANIAALLSNSKEYFKKELKPELVEAQYKSVLSKYPDNAEVAEADKTTTCRTKLQVNSYQETVFLVQNPDDYSKFHQGTMHDLRQGAYVVPVFQDYGIYIKQTSSGGYWMAKRIMIFHTESSFDDGSFNVDDAPFEIERDFVPPNPIDNTIDQSGLTTVTDNVTEQTVINGNPPPPPPPTNTDDGPAVMF